MGMVQHKVHLKNRSLLRIKLKHFAKQKLLGHIHMANGESTELFNFLYKMFLRVSALRRTAAFLLALYVSLH